MMELGIGSDYPITVDGKIKQLYELCEHMQNQINTIATELEEVLRFHAQQIVDDIKKGEVG